MELCKHPCSSESGKFWHYFSVVGWELLRPFAEFYKEVPICQIVLIKTSTSSNIKKWNIMQHIDCAHLQKETYSMTWGDYWNMSGDLWCVMWPVDVFVYVWCVPWQFIMEHYDAAELATVLWHFFESRNNKPGHNLRTLLVWHLSYHIHSYGGIEQ